MTAPLPAKLYCGTDHYGCEDHLIDIAEITVEKNKTLLKRVFKEGDNPWEATFTGEVSKNGKAV